MTPFEELKTAVNTAYHLLPTNNKHLASSEHGCSEAHFRKMVKGDPKISQSEYLKALTSIKKASQKGLDQVDTNHKKIIGIVAKHISAITLIQS